MTADQKGSEMLDEFGNSGFETPEVARKKKMGELSLQNREVEDTASEHLG